MAGQSLRENGMAEIMTRGRRAAHASPELIDMLRTSGELLPSPADAAEAERCKVPDFAKAMGHEEKWKLHNNCK